MISLRLNSFRVASRACILAALIASYGTSAATDQPRERTPQMFRDFATLSHEDLSAARERLLDTVVLTDIPAPNARVIKMVGIDGRTGNVMLYLLNTCTGQLFDVTGQVVYQYPGDWGDVDC
ncbi:hypothetical protein [Lysobacter capsici]|uniref:hypothetical protein n=1 Tax=Lysobacter capsici TaxID=435897 RepID=UPI001C003CAF|nr:hypothetical protein [Lysobacter capsici]QWF16939.1 hypothetical protein KME82_24950 [Lysobacter capsici]